MDKQHKKRIKQYTGFATAALTVFLLAAMPLIVSQNVPTKASQASILTAQVQRGSIDTQIIGGGQLSSTATRKVTIPEAVKLTQYLVDNGDMVKSGDPIARVDTVSVMAALAQVQETLDYLAQELEDAASDADADTVTAHAGGLVKILYGQEGDSVRDVMLQNGALAVLSLDGRMAVDIIRETDLRTGDIVSVTLSDGTALEGRVESAAGGVLTVSIVDEGYAIGETVAVKAEDGHHLGSGALYIHNPWNASAYYGSISRVHVREGDHLSAGKALFDLEVDDYSSHFRILHQQRQNYEELMQELFAIYHSGVICAPCDGIVTGVDTNGAFLLSAAETGSGWCIQLLENVTGHEQPSDLTEETSPVESPGSLPSEEPEPPEITYSVLVGQVTADDQGTLILNAYPEAVSCANLREIRVDTALMTDITARNISGTVILETDLVTIHSDAIVSGDILYFVTASDGSAFVVWAGNQPDSPGGSGQQAGEMGSMGSMGGGTAGGMAAAAAPVFEPYSLDTLTIASVTSQEEMTLEITVDEQDISRLYPGQDACVTVDALTGQSFPAVITSIGNTGTSSGGSSKFTAVLTLSKSGDMLPGMNASAYLTPEITENVLTLPTAALVEEGTRTLVYTGYDETEHSLTGPLPVKTGASDGMTTEILSGLSEGDRIYYAYFDTPEISLTPEQSSFRPR